MTDFTAVLGTMLADLATQVTNKAVNSDPQLQSQLKALAGNTIEINCTTPSFMPVQIWHMVIVDDALNLHHGPADAPQVVVTGSAVDLATWMFPAATTGRVQIDGDETLLQELVEILRGFKPAVASPLEQFFGAQATSSLLGTAELGLNGLRSMIQGIGQNIQGQAMGNFVQQGQLDTILQNIDDLRLEVDRLAARVGKDDPAPPSDNKPNDT